jgi:hypothetical protein
MSNQWSKIYNQKNFHRNLNSLKAIILAKKKSLSYKKLSLELFKIMNPQSNSSSLYKSFLDFMNFIKINTEIKNVEKKGIDPEKVLKGIFDDSKL